MNRLRELRLRKKKTVNDVGFDLRIAPATISRYENGDREPSHEKLIAFAEYYGVSVDYILGRAEPEQTQREKESLITVERLEALGFDIEKIASLTDVQLAKVEAYIQGLLDKK